MPNNRRKYLIAKIHVAKKELGLEDETYRDLLLTNTGKTSCSELSVKELENLFRQLQIVYGYREPARQKQKPQLAKIRALLADKGHREGMMVPEQYAVAILKRQCGVERLEWATSAQLRAVIAALEAAKRKAVNHEQQG